MSWYVEILHRDGSVASRSPLGAKPLTIGRSPDCDLVVDDAYVAPHHASVTIDENNQVLIRDLNSLNGIRDAKGKRFRYWKAENASPIRLGHTLLRVRSTQWALAPERPLPNRWRWVWAMIALLLCLGGFAWDEWTGAIDGEQPEYLAMLSAGALGLAIWAGLFSLLGRLLRGEARFASHLLVACLATLGMYLAHNVLNILSFSMGWVWPRQVNEELAWVLLGLAAGANLYLADPRHWPIARWVVAVLAAGAIVVPSLELWIKERRFSRIDASEVVSYPALRLAEPVSLDDYEAQWTKLREKVNADKKRKEGDASASSGQEQAASHD